MKNEIQSIWSKMTQSATLKAMIIGILFLLMLIPVSMIHELIQEREHSGEEVSSEISSKWGDQQTFIGPVITVPYQYDVMQNNQLTKVQEYAYFLPEELNIETELVPDILYRSIYKVVVYQSNIKAKGSFEFPDFGKLNIQTATIDWQNAFITIGISDLRGIRSNVVFKWNGEEKEVISGTENSDVTNLGVHVKIPFTSATPSADTRFNFEVQLTLNGSQGLFFLPMAQTTNVSLTSTWDTPSFDGAFLPDTRNVTDKGFDATWKIFHFNRNFPQTWAGDSYHPEGAEFGVRLILPINHYQKTMRSVKYAIMFIALTFLVFFLVELISRRRIHPMQYLLVSIGLVLFYSLLLAISEQLNFMWAYCISALAIVGLITSYSYSIFKNVKQTCMMGGFLTLLYLFLYTVLQLEDMALLIGSVGLFIALAVVMYFSRKVDWYYTNDSENE